MPALRLVVTCFLKTVFLSISPERAWLVEKRMMMTLSVTSLSCAEIAIDVFPCGWLGCGVISYIFGNAAWWYRLSKLCNGYGLLCNRQISSSMTKKITVFFDLSVGQELNLVFFFFFVLIKCPATDLSVQFNSLRQCWGEMDTPSIFL